MGLAWVDSVAERLISAGFRTQRGYPGTKAVCLSGTVAAVNMTGLDSEQFTVKVTVSVLTPRSEGLTHCQTRAAEAVEALTTNGEQWSFSGWKYDSGIDCFCVEVNGVKSADASGGDDTQAQRYQVLIGEERQEFVTDFLARQQMDRRLIRPHGQSEPVAVTPGMGGWIIKLTQLLPPEQTEPVQPEEPFTLTVIRGGHSQVFLGCCWSDYSSQQKADGTEVIRSGFALSREVS